MADTVPKEERSIIMSKIRSRNTSIELNLRHELFQKGFRNYRIKNTIYGKPDLIFPKQKIAIFIDWCFWHWCKKCLRMPHTNKKYWKQKIENNILRDKLVNKVLKKEWRKILRFWEHQIKKELNSVIEKIERNLDIK